MCEVTSLMSLKKVPFSWKIENFDQVMNLMEATYDSEEIGVVTSDGKRHALKLRIQKVLIDSAAGVRIENERKKAEDFDIFDMSVVKLNVKDIFKIDGGILNGDGGKLIGKLHEYGSCWKFKNKRPIGSFDGQQWNNESYAFCVAKETKTMKLNVEFTLLVANEHLVKENGIASMVNDYKSLMIRAGESSDFTIVCDGHKFPCHETVLRARSPVFDRMFHQKNVKEVTTRNIAIDDTSKNTMEATLEYIYIGEITKNIENLLEMIYIADKYDISGLMKLCLFKLLDQADDKVVDILIQLDRQGGFDDVKKLVMTRIVLEKSKFMKNDFFLEKMKENPQLLIKLFQI